MRMAFTSIVAGALLGAALATAATAPSDAKASLTVLRQEHRGKAGVYMRLSAEQAAAVEAPPKRAQNPSRKQHQQGVGRPRRKDKADPELLHTHPLLDAVILTLPWQQVEPQRGQFAFQSLVDEVDQWGKGGKGVILGLALYGQNPEDKVTPSWVYEQPGVRMIGFHGGGVAKGQPVRVPAVWDPSFVDQFLTPLITAMARAVDGNPHVWYIKPGFGHIGNMTAQPSKEGGPAFLQAGFTPEKWKAYCRRSLRVYQAQFTKTPRLCISPATLIREHKQHFVAAEVTDLMSEFGREGVALIHYDLEGDRSKIAHALGDLSGVAAAARQGMTRIGIGDDWPLWVPESRRSQGPTRGHDDAYFSRVLTYAFGGVDGLPELPITILNCQVPEILASHPEGRDYRPEVAAALKKARDHALRNDRVIFGGS
jgi:hypothetical protein